MEEKKLFRFDIFHFSHICKFLHFLHYLHYTSYRRKIGVLSANKIKSTSYSACYILKSAVQRVIVLFIVPYIR